MKIATASDHAGLEMKNIINDFIAEKGYEVLDLGTYEMCIRDRFEAAPEFFGRNPGEQRAMASGIRVGKTAKKDWTNSMRAYDVFDVKADALAVIAAAKGPIEAPQITTDAPSYLSLIHI